MPTVKNQEELIQAFRKEYPDWAYRRADEQIYNLWADESRKAGRQVPDYVAPSISSININTTGFNTTPKKTGSPKDFEELQKMGDSMLTTGLSEVGVEEGFMGISADFYKNSFNQSFAGLAYQAMYGRPKYELDDKDYKLDGFLQEAGSYLLGMVNPIDAAIFAGSMGTSVLAGGATRAGLGFLSQKAKKAFVSETIKGKSKLATSLITHGVEGGFGLGTYGSAHAALASASDQKMKTGSIDGNKVAEDASDAFIESFMLGAPAGMIGRGALGSFYATKKMAEKPLSNIPRIATGLPGQYATEIATFAALPSLYKAVGAESYKDYPMIFSDEWNKMLAMDATMSAPLFFGPPAIKKIFSKNAKLAVDNQIKFEEADIEAITTSYDNLEANGFNLGDNFAAEVSQHAAVAAASRKEVKRYTENIDRLQRIYEESGGNPNNIRQGDKEFIVGLDGQEAISFHRGILKDLINNPARLQEVANIVKQNKGLTGDATPIEVAALKTEFQDTLEILRKSKEDFTQLATGLKNMDAEADIDATEFVSTSTAETTDSAPTIIGDTGTSTASDLPGKRLSVAEFRRSAVDAPDEQVAERIKKLADILEQQEAETPFSNPKDIERYNFNQRIVARIIQQSLPAQTSKRGGTKGSYVEDFDTRARRLHRFNKYVVKAGYDFKNVTDDIVLKFVRENRDADTVINQILPKLMGPFGNRNLTLTAAEVKSASAKIVQKVRPGLLSDANNTVIGNNSITMPLKKQAATGPQEKYITSKTSKILKKLQEDSKRTLSKYLFNDKDGYSLGNAEANALAVKIFGAKPDAVSNSPARAFRKAMLTWAQKKYKGMVTPETELIKLEILKDKSNIDKITEAYGKADFKKEARSLVNEFLKDIETATGTSKGKQTYSIQEIKKGLATDFSKDIIIKVKGKERVIPGDVAEGFARFLVEAGPRINEIVPRKRVASGEFQKQTIGAPAGVKEMKRIIREEIAKNPNVKVKTNQDMDAAGMFADGVIYINLKKANKKTWYHENAHRLKDLIDKTNNKELKKVWKRGEKIFAKDAKKAKQPLSEFIPDEIMRWADDQSRTPTLASKMKTWAEQLWSTVTKVFFGKDYLTKLDVRRLLGERVLKGFEDIPEYRKAVRNSEGMPQYQFASVQERAASVKKDFDFAVKQSGGMSRSTRNEVFKQIAKDAGIEDFDGFKLTGKDLSEIDIIKFSQRLNEVPFEDIARVAKMEGVFQTVNEIRAIEEGFIDKKMRNKMLSFFKIKADNLYQLANDVKAANKYKNFLMETKYPNTNKAGAHLLERIVQSDNTLPNNIIADFERPGSFKNWMLRGIYSGHSYIGSLGGKMFKALENKLLQHASSEFRHVANFVEKFEGKVSKLLGSNWEKKFGDDIGTVLDKQALLETLDLNKLTSSQKKLFKKIYKSDAIVVKDGKHVMNTKYNHKTRFKERPKLDTDNPELAAVYAYFDFTNNVKKEFADITRKYFDTEAEHKEFLDTRPLKFLENEVYVRYELTKEARKMIDRAGSYQTKFINDAARKEAKKMAIEKYGTKATAENMEEFAERALMRAQDLYNNMQTYRESFKISDSFFKNRNDKLPEYLEVDGKTIKMYNRKYGAIKAYGLGVAKALATIEHFPDRYKIKFKHGPEHYSSQKMLLELKDKSPEHGRVVNEIVNRQLGEYGSYNEAIKEFGGFFNQTASIFAKTALGFPTSGYKNLALGQVQNASFLDFSDYFRGIIDSMNSDVRANLRLTGLTEVGLRHVDDITFTPKLWDTIFKLGGMRPTENANRYIAVAGAKRYARKRIDRIFYKHFNSKVKAKAEGQLKDKFFLNDDQINLLKKYGNDGLVGHTDKMSTFDRKKIQLELDNIEQQIATYAHINTQGASTGLFQPIWANGPMSKPLTLFLRMAYKASDNTIRNVKTAYKHGDYGKLATIGLAPFAAGYTIAAVNHALLGTPMPKENSNHAKWAEHLLVQGESLGVATSIYSYLRGEAAETTVYPAMINWTHGFVDLFRAPIQGKKTVRQSGADFLKSISSGYRGYIKTLDRINNPFKLKYNKYRTLKYDFLEEMYPNEDSGPSYRGNDSESLGTRSDAYRDFKTVFMSGKVDDIAKQYATTMFVVAADMMRQELKKGQNYTSSDFNIYLKKAVKQLENDITSFHPNPYDLNKKYTGDSKKKNEEIRVAWYEWLAKDPERAKVYGKELTIATNEYNSKIMGLTKHIQKYIKDPEILKQAKKNIRRHLKSNTIMF